ncbi:MAG TPA: replication-relaxation family protein [Solirubrobacterales bacterium]|nr:replication-relaxation family protein [Solirubrobacterales bacterium]
MPRLGAAAVGMLEGLDRHRLLSTAQLHALYTPQSSLRWTQHLLGRLRESGLAEAARTPGGLGLWYLTPRGVAAIGPIVGNPGERRKAISPEQAAGPLQSHTLAVNEVGLAFVRAARERGDECGPLAWRHEVVHSLGRPPGQRRAELLIADALLTYQQNGPGDEVNFHYRFVELDRATMGAERLVEQLTRYARLYHRTLPADDPLDEPEPAWAASYPVFPAVLVVLAGLPPERAERRRTTVLELLAEDDGLGAATEVSLSICSLDDLVSRGPFAPIFRSLHDPERPVDWLGEDGS